MAKSTKKGKKTPKKNTQKRTNERRNFTRELVFMFILGLLALLNHRAGIVGEVSHTIYVLFFGMSAFVFEIFTILIAFLLLIRVPLREYKNAYQSQYIGFLIFLSSILILIHVYQILGKTDGKNITILHNFSVSFNTMFTDVPLFIQPFGTGLFGTVFASILLGLLSEVGTLIILTLSCIFSLFILSGLDFDDFFKRQFESFKERRDERRQEKDQNEIPKDSTNEEIPEALPKPSTKKEDSNVVYDVDLSDPMFETTALDRYDIGDVNQPLDLDSVYDGMQDSQKANSPIDIPLPGDGLLLGNELQEIKQDALDHSSDIATHMQYKDYVLPPQTLLNGRTGGQADQKQLLEHVKANAQRIMQTFEHFNIQAKVTGYSIGPNITQYEVKPDVGVKVSKFLGLENDLALALAAKDIRIQAPIPGKSVIGIEVPNSETTMVSMLEIWDTPVNNLKAPLQVALGKDLGGNPVFAPLEKMPHLLVAGSTGSGKSVCVNSIITSILLKAQPTDVQLLMIDPKKVELSVYNGIPHLITPVITDPKKASLALKKMVQEMENRYEIFAATGTKNIESYNTYLQKNKSDIAPMPYIVVIIDELADLMMVASTEVETSIARLAQMARASGIHLIIATQRPSTDVITGLIKANIPSRISFAVSSSIDSRTILDKMGAEKLLGKGDMLFQPSGENQPRRIQGNFLSEEEVERIVQFIKEKNGNIQVSETTDFTSKLEVASVALEVDDDLFPEAVRIVVALQKASTSLLQRKLKIGYNRAANIMELLEEKEIIGMAEGNGNKPREVLVQHIPSEYAEEVE